MKISSFTWGFVALAILAVVALGVGAALSLLNDGHGLFGVVVLLLDAGCVPYFVWAFKKTPLYDNKTEKKED